LLMYCYHPAYTQHSPLIRTTPYIHPHIFYKDPATTPIYTLSLHDALPIFPSISTFETPPVPETTPGRGRPDGSLIKERLLLEGRSEEHTSELQSLTNIVCRLLLGKKNNRALIPYARNQQRQQQGFGGFRHH